MNINKNRMLMLYVAIVALSGYGFYSFSAAALGVVFAIITLFRGFQLIKPGLHARVIFCLHLGCSVSLIITGWQQYGWVPGIFILFAVMLCLTLWTPRDSEPEAHAAAVMPGEKERLAWRQQPVLAIQHLDSPHGFYTTASTCRKGIAAYHLPDIIRYPAAHDSQRDAWRFAVIENSLSVIPGGRYVTPVTLGDAHSDRRFDWGLFAFRNVTKKHYGLRYKHACVEFPAGWLTGIAVVENTCRNADWHTLLFIASDSAVMVDFPGAEADGEKLYSFAVVLAEAWDVRLTQRYANHN